MTPDKRVESDYARGYKQGKFDAEMDATQYHQDLMSEVIGSFRLLLAKHYKTEDFDVDGCLSDLQALEAQTIIKLSK